MKISELEYHHNQYMTLEDKIKAMLDNQEFPAIFSLCVESFPHIIPAIQYRKKREIKPKMPTMLAFKVILTYAPLLFEHNAIESLSEFVNSTRLLVKHENCYLQEIASAIVREEIARVIWNFIERQPGAMQKEIWHGLGVKQRSVTDIVEIWEQLGVIIRKKEENNNRLYFQTRLNEEVEGVCQNCGVHGKGHKELFFKSILCQKCGKEGYYHIKYTDH